MAFFGEDLDRLWPSAAADGTSDLEVVIERRDGLLSIDLLDDAE